MMNRTAVLLAAVVAAPFAASASAAASPVEILIGDAGQRDAQGAILVDLRLLNGSADPQTVALPAFIQAQIITDDTSRTVWLDRTAAMPTDITVPPDGFRRAVYRFRDPSALALDGATLSIPAWSVQKIAVTVRDPQPVQLAQANSAAVPAPDAGTSLVSGPENGGTSGAQFNAAPPPSYRAAGNSFVSNLSAYEPIYAVYGPGTDSEARIQISFKYQLFGTRRDEGLPLSLRDGLYFAFTQRMFWDVGAKSSPFRNVDYQPELFYLTPSATLANGISLSAQGGIRHESNGRDGLASRSINSVYLAPMAAVPLGGGYRLSVAPRLSFFVGDKSDNPDIRRYRGNTALFLEIGDDDGLRISTSTRYNFGSGKGAISADASYPLPRLLGGGPDFYLFAQSFTGYGENLLDYNRRMTRVRIGVALVR